MLMCAELVPRLVDLNANFFSRYPRFDPMGVSDAKHPILIIEGRKAEPRDNYDTSAEGDSCYKLVVLHNGSNRVLPFLKETLVRRPTLCPHLASDDAEHVASHLGVHCTRS